MDAQGLVPESDYKNFFEHLPGLYLVLDPTFRIVAVSDAYLESTMTLREDILGKDVFDVFPDNPDETGATGVRNVCASLERVRETGLPDVMAVQKYDIRRPAASGGAYEERYWSPVNAPIFKDGQIAYLVHRVEDVTAYVLERRAYYAKLSAPDVLSERAARMEAEISFRASQLQQANKLLREANTQLDSLVRAKGGSTDSDLHLAALVNGSDDAILSKDLEGRVLSWNKSAERLYGYTADEMIGRSVGILFPSERLGDLTRFLERLKRSERIERFETVRLKKDGTRIRVVLTISPILSPEGKVVAASALARDITMEKKRDDDLMESEEKFRQLAENVNAVFWLTNVDNSQMIYISPAYEKIWGCTCESLYKNPLSFLERVHPEDRKRMEEVVRDKSGGFDREYRIIRPDGKIRWIHDRGFPVRDAQGRVYRAGGIAEDITDKKKIETQLAQSLKIETVGTLAGGVAHDLNNQLTPVKGYLDMILQQIGPDDPLYESVAEASIAAGRCAEIVQRLVSFSRPSGEGRSCISLAAVLSELKQLLAKFLPSTIEVAIQCPADLWPLEGNATELQTIFMNMAINARDAMPHGGSFSITARNVKIEERPHSHYVLVEAKDTGQGMPPEVVERIFEPFFTTKQKREGTGLGLAMVFQIVQSHKGWIEVSSGLNQGTVFQVYLPARPGATVEEGANAVGIPFSLRGQGQTLILADDEEAVRRMGGIFLERLGYRALMARDGVEAVALYAEHKDTVAAVLLDMTMPKMTGKECIRQLLAINAGLPIVASSGFTSEGAADEILAAGASGFLKKPYTIAELGQALKKVLTDR